MRREGLVMGASYGDFVKYPRTPHLVGSIGTADDTHLSAQQTADFLANESLIVEEKLDGTNVGIHFSDDGKLVLQCRGHLVTEGMHPQYDLFKQWTATKQHAFADFLQRRYIMFGEWLYARHNTHYQRLPHYFFAFDIYDKHETVFLDHERRADIIRETVIHTVPVLHAGPATLDQLEKLITASQFSGAFERSSTNSAEQLMEGLYLRIEAGGAVAGRAKFVRREFAAKVSQNTNWRHQAVVPNLLSEGANIWK